MPTIKKLMNYVFIFVLFSLSANALMVEDNLYPNTWGSFRNWVSWYGVVIPFIPQHNGELKSFITPLGCDVVNGYNTTLTYYLEIYDGLKSNSSNKVAQTNNVVKNCAGYSDEFASIENLNFTVTSFSNLNKTKKYYTYFISPNDGLIFRINATSGFDNWFWNTITLTDDSSPSNNVINYRMILNVSDIDNDLVPDEDDLCPLVYGTMAGCPDTEAPNITVISPLNDTYQISFIPNYTVSDSSSYSCELLNSTISEGVNYWQVNCTDIFNNSAVSEQRMFKMDTIVPAITLISPLNNSYQTSLIPNYSVVEINNYTCFSINNSISEGLNHWSINCTDEAGNSQLSEQWMFKKDTTLPTTTRNLTTLLCSDNFICQKTFYSFDGINFSIGTEFNLTGNLTNVSYYSIDENNNTESINNEIIINDTDAPEISLSYSSGILYALTNENATCYYNTTDTNLTSMGNATTTNQVTLSLPYGSHNYYVECYDASLNKANNSIAITLTPPPTPPASSSGGGGGGSSSSEGFSAPSVPSNKENIIIQQIDVGEKKEIKLNNEQVAIKEIHIEVNNQVKNIDITITKQEGKPAEVTHEVDNVYQYLSIEHKNLDNIDIDKAVLTFEVDKKWMEDEGIDENSVSLQRYSNGEWTKLNTHKATVNMEKILYEAETSGFSYFAISGEKKIEIVKEISAETNIELEQQTSDDDEIAQELPKEKPKQRSYFLVILSIALIVAVVVVCIFLSRIKKKK